MLKKKIKKWVIGLIVSNLPIILIALVVACGIMAVTSFFGGLSKWGEKKNIDINNCTIEQLIKAVDDKSIFTTDLLNDMNINRKSLKRILVSVSDYNKRSENREITVIFDEGESISSTGVITSGGSKNYDVNDKGEDDNKAGKKVKVKVNNDSITDPYPLDWQVVYIFCLMQSITNLNEMEYSDVAHDDKKEIATLTNAEIDAIIKDLKPKFTYNYNVVKDTKKEYTQKEVKKLPHNPVDIKWNKTLAGVKYMGSYKGNVPISTVKKVDALMYTEEYSYTKSYQLQQVKTTSREDRLLAKGQKYNEDFDMDLFYELLNNLPGGEKLANKYMSLFSLYEYDQSYDIVSFDDDSYSDDSIDGSSGLGEDIVKYALQFCGNPYVWGGTDLIHGADCSGFCQSVFKHFGIKLPRTSREQAKDGVNVPLNSIQPGDLLFYTKDGVINHVAIYMGNKKVVMAGSEETGIHTSRYNYREPVVARRYY